MLIPWVPSSQQIEAEKERAARAEEMVKVMEATEMKILSRLKQKMEDQRNLYRELEGSNEEV